MAIEIVRTPGHLRATLNAWRGAGQRIALVPTMGAIHQGHLDLVIASRLTADKVIASIFVNPTQFAAHEDLSSYPRDEAGDARVLEAAGCNLIYAPNVETMYPSGFATTIQVSGITQELEGIFRPHFFGGVATIVTKLFIQAAPDVALFGEKDWQQLQVVRALVRDLDLPLEIIGVPTRRESDGLALSSRNAYLSAEQRAVAPALKHALDHICAALENKVPALEAETAAQQALLKAGFGSIDYLTARHAETLMPWKSGDPLRVLGAAFLGKTRLIDNRGA
jgi:pantoate--beta-alanine ligase